MTKLEQLKQMIADDFEKSKDADQVKKLALQKQLLDDVEAETSELLTTHQKLKEEYVKSVKSSVVGNTPSGEQKPRSMKEIVKSLGFEKQLKL